MFIFDFLASFLYLFHVPTLVNRSLLFKLSRLVDSSIMTLPILPAKCISTIPDSLRYLLFVFSPSFSI